MDIINGVMRKKKLQKITVRRESWFSIPEQSSVKYCRLNLGRFLLLLWEDAQKGPTVSKFRISCGAS